MIRSLICFCFAVLLAASSSANAAWRIGLAALSHDGSRAIVVYGNEWVEVDLKTGDATLLVPSVTCAWTSAAYAPSGTDFAMTAHCVWDMACDRVRTDVWIAKGDDRLVNVIFVFGKRWNDAVWRDGPRGGEILVRETPVYDPIALGLNDLGASSECQQGNGRLATVSLDSGRVAGFDIAPRGWSVTAPLAADGGSVIAEMRATARSNSGTSAEAEIAAICSGEDAAGDDWRREVCSDEGQQLRFEWSDGDWTLLDQPDTGWGRLVVSADMTTRAREICEGEQVEGRLKARCSVRINGPDGERVIEAPGGLFGDMALSGDGKVFASLAAGRGLNIRRFDIFDAATGEVTDLSHLLDLQPPWAATR